MKMMKIDHKETKKEEAQAASNSPDMLCHERVM